MNNCKHTDIAPIGGTDGIVYYYCVNCEKDMTEEPIEEEEE